MSTLKTNKIRNTSATVDNLELDSSGNVSVYGVGDVATALAAKADSSALATAGGLVLVSPTSIANSGGTASASGGAVSFSGVTSVSLNGVFSSTYDNYRLVLSLTAGTSEGATQFRLRASGTDATGTDYVSQLVSGNGSTAGAARITGGTYIRWGFYDTGDPGSASSADVYQPNIAAPTFLIGHSASRVDGTSNLYLFVESGRHGLSTAYDGFTLTVSGGSGTMTGSIRTYAYKN